MSRPDAVLTWQRARLGFTETPDNITPFAAIAGHTPGLPWCCTFRVASHKSTATPIPPGGGTASSLVNHAAYERAGLLVPAADAQPGDLFWLLENGVVAHEGTVLARVGATTRFTTYEGNWGNRVVSLTRDYSVGGATRVGAFARPRWDGVTPAILNLPTDRATVTMVHQAIPAAAHTPTIAPGQVATDGRLGPATWTATQRALGVTADGIPGARTISALQRLLNDRLRAGLAVDGSLGPATIRALQAWLGTPRDGVLSSPVSTAVLVWQQRLNAGTFTRAGVV